MVCHHNIILASRNVRAVLVCLELSDRGTSTHVDQLCPKLHWLLKHQKDPQSLEWAAAGMPFYYSVIWPHASRQQVVPVVEQLVIFAAVSHPDV